MKIKNTSTAAAIAITLGLGFVATPQVEAQGFLRYFGVKNSSSHSKGHGHSQKAVISKSLHKNVADLDRYSAELIAVNSKAIRGHQFGRKGYGHGRSGGGLQGSLQNFSAKVDSLVWATKGGNPRTIKSAANDAQYAFSSVKSAAIRSNSNSDVKSLIKRTSPIVSLVQKEALSITSVAVTRTPVANNSHYNRRSFTPVPTVSPWSSRDNRTSTTTAATTNNNSRNTSVATTTTTTNNTRNTDRSTITATTTNNDRNSDRGGNNDTRNNDGGDRNQQGNRGDRGSR